MILLKIQETASGLMVTEYKGKFDILDILYTHAGSYVSGSEEKAVYTLIDWIENKKKNEAKKKQEPYK